MKNRTLILLIPIFILYIIIFRFVYLENGLTVLVSVCIPILSGLFLAVFINPLLIFIEEILKVKNRNLCILFTYLIFFGFISSIILIIAPGLINSFTLLLNDIPKLLIKANNYLLSISEKYKVFKETDILYPLLKEYLYIISQRITALLSSFLNMAIEKVINIIFTVENLLLSLIISGYVLKDKEKIENWFYRLCFILFNKKYAFEVINISRALNKNITSFIIGKFVISIIIGLFTYLGSKFIIDAPYPVIDGLVIGITNIIPYFGAFIGGIPVVLINLLYNPNKGFLMGVFILILQQIDGLIISPKILGSQLSINPLIIIVSIIIGGGLFGPLGLFLATPVAALIKTSIDTYMRFKLSEIKDISHIKR